MTRQKDFENLQDLYFLGPKGEQRKFFQEMIELINNDMIFWRRNFWPKDPPVIPYRNLTSETGQDYQVNFIQSLVELLGELKMDVPFFSPRYVAHMTGDLTLPGLIGYYAGLLYNSNNVSAEASPVTLKYELEVGRDFARLFGFDEATSFGHITSGGTVANFESVFYHKGARFIPASMGLALKKEKLPWPSFLPTGNWELLNFSIEEVPKLLEEFCQHGRKHGFDHQELLRKYSPAHLGEIKFWNELRIEPPVLIVPATAHYSWSKAANLFGIGRENCLQVRVDNRLCMSMIDLQRVLKYCHDLKRPVLQTVCVLGTTEYGSFDPLEVMVKLLKEWKEMGLYSPLHLDAAYGGYFQTMFVPGSKFPEKAIEACEKFHELKRIFSSVKEADSITVDPHKLGQVPYGAGVFITKHGFSKEFIAEEADYCLTSQSDDLESFPLGKYILEGSKSGASAAAVYFSHKIVPMNSDGFGGLNFELLNIAERFHDLLKNASDDDLEFVPINEPQSSLLCFFVCPNRSRKISEINDFTQRLIWHFFPRPTDHIQEFSYYMSKTSLKFNKLEGEGPMVLQGLERDCDHLKLARLVFLNRWFDKENGRGTSYMEDFIFEIKKKCRELLKT